jgi:hypothetical protein
MLANTRDNGQLELRLGTLESTDFLSFKDALTNMIPEISVRPHVLYGKIAGFPHLINALGRCLPQHVCHHQLRCACLCVCLRRNGGLPFPFSLPIKTYARFVECIAENATRLGSRFCTKRIVRPLREPCSCARRPGR